ncbi:hypothetical protein J5690_09915 [bacterium]|nr:hypothetical protein [bacterium]
MKKFSLFISLFIILAIFASSCATTTKNTYENLYYAFDKNIAEYEAKLANSQNQSEETVYRAVLADFYNAKAQFLLASHPERSDEAMKWIEMSLQMCEYIMENLQNEYTNNQTVSFKTNMTMANNMFLQDNQGEVEQWCSRLPENVECPQIIKELKQ